MGNSTSLEKHLVVFDFDCTLTTKHYYHYINDYKYFRTKEQWKSEVLEFRRDELIHTLNTRAINEEHKNILINEFFGGEERFNLLVSGINKLRQQGCTIIIASRGKKSEIENLLYCIEQSNLFNKIFDREMDKTKLILTNITNGDYKAIYYMDDDSREHEKLLDIILETPIHESSNIFFYVNIRSDDIDAPVHVKSNFQYNFYNKLKKEAYGLSKEEIRQILEYINSNAYYLQETQIVSSNAQDSSEQTELKQKYLKYKMKYLNLKKSF